MWWPSPTIRRAPALSSLTDRSTALLNDAEAIGGKPWAHLGGAVWPGDVEGLHSVDGATAEMVALGLSLGQYRFDDYRSEPKPAKTETVVFVDGTDDDAAEAGRGATIAKGVAVARDLINEPSAGKPPAGIADRAVAMAADVGVRAVVHDPEAMEEAGMGGVLGVGMGSTNPPRLVELWHEPEDAASPL